MNLRAPGLLLLLATLSCGEHSDGLERLEALYPTPKPKTEEERPIDDIGTPMCNGLDGNWAVRLVQKGTIEPLGQPWDLTVTDLFLASKSQAGTEMQLRFCNQDVAILADGKRTTLGQPETPATLKSALYLHPLRVPLPGDGTFAARDVVWLWGLEGLANPLTDALPTKADYQGDARVIDQDNDSFPGVTVNVLSPSGQRYMVRRGIFTFEPGRLALSNQWLTGVLVHQLTEHALGASNTTLETAAPITPRAEGTMYQLRCVGSTYTCASLEKDHAALFKDAPR